MWYGNMFNVTYRGPFEKDWIFIRSMFNFFQNMLIDVNSQKLLAFPVFLFIQSDTLMHRSSWSKFVRNSRWHKSVYWQSATFMLLSLLFGTENLLRWVRQPILSRFYRKVVLFWNLLYMLVSSMWQPWKWAFQISSCKEHNWSITPATALWNTSSVCVQATLPTGAPSQ